MDVESSAGPYRDSILIDAAPAIVFDYFTDASALASWMGDNAMLQDRGFLQPRLQISPDGAGGLTMTSGKPAEIWSGSIAPDGAVVWTSKRGDSFRVRIAGNEAVIENVVLENGVVLKTKSDVRYRGHLPAAAPLADSAGASRLH